MVIGVCFKTLTVETGLMCLKYFCWLLNFLFPSLPPSSPWELHPLSVRHSLTLLKPEDVSAPPVWGENRQLTNPRNNAPFQNYSLLQLSKLPALASRNSTIYLDILYEKITYAFSDESTIFLGK